MKKSGIAAVMVFLLGSTFYSAQAADPREMILNGDFSVETTPGVGTYGWLTSGSPQEACPHSSTETARETYVNNGTPIPTPACLVVGQEMKGIGFLQSDAVQNVSIPVDALPATITVYYQWHTFISFGLGAVYARATFGGNTLFEIVETAGFGWTPTPGWKRVDTFIPDIKNYAGTPVELRFTSCGDVISAGEWNYFYVDDVSLMVITATKTNTPTATPTYTISPTCTISPTDTVTATVTPSFTISPTVTHTPTITPMIIPAGKPSVYPNPASGNQVNFIYSLTEPGNVKIDVYNTLGMKVARLEDKNVAGLNNRRTSWNITNVAPGVYLYQITVEYSSGQSEKFAIKRLVISK